MPTYTFRGRDMSEAVEQVRNTLGSEAVIIDTLRGTDHIGRFVEITATGELKSPVQQQYPPQKPAPQTSSRTQQLTQRGGAPIPPPRSGRRSPVRNSYTDRMGPPQLNGMSRAGDIPAPNHIRTDHYSVENEAITPQRNVQRDGGVTYTPSHRDGHIMPTQMIPHPLKGADRYVHPNTFSTPRDVIIPQPIPLNYLSSQQQEYREPLHRAQRHQAQRQQAQRQHTQIQQAQRQHTQRQHTQIQPAHLSAQRATPQSPTAWSQPQSQSYPQPPHKTNSYTAPLTPPLSRRSSLQDRNRRPDLSPPTEINPIQSSLKAVQGALKPQGPEAVQFVTERLNEIVSYIQSGQNSGGIPAPVFDHLRQFHLQLQAAGIERRYAEQLIEQTKARIRLNQLDKQVILAHLGQVLAQNISCIDPLKSIDGKKNVLAFVGPTGVGKTTTIAKIAAHAHLTHEIPVTLISTDTFRMAAVEQLSRYAEILDCPAEAAHNPSELWRLIDQTTTPLVLVDTTGRNPKTPGQLKILSEFFGEGWKGRTVLTVAANTREQDLKPITEGFSPLKYDMVTITKLDETYALGTIYNVSQYTQCPVSWTTNGQRVPEDIELANPESIAVKIIMEAISHKV